MKNCFKMALIGAVAGFLVALVAFNIARAAAPSPAEEDNNKLEQLVSQNDACRLLVYASQSGMSRLYFPNKSDAQKAVNRIFAQAEAARPYKTVFILSPDCDLDLSKP